MEAPIDLELPGGHPLRQLDRHLVVAQITGQIGHEVPHLGMPYHQPPRTYEPRPAEVPLADGLPIETEIVADGQAVQRQIEEDYAREQVSVGPLFVGRGGRIQPSLPMHARSFAARAVASGDSTRSGRAPAIDPRR